MIRHWKTKVEINLDMPERSTGEQVREEIARALAKFDGYHWIDDPIALGFKDDSEAAAFWRHYDGVQARLDELERLEPDAVSLLAAVRERWIAAEVPEIKVNALKTLESETIRAALLKTAGNKKQAAGLLGIKRTTLHEKLRRMEKAA